MTEQELKEKIVGGIIPIIEFIGIEKNDKYFEIAKRRINEAKSNNGGDQCQSV